MRHRADAEVVLELREIDLTDLYWTLGVAKRALGLQSGPVPIQGTASLERARELVMNADRILWGTDNV